MSNSVKKKNTLHAASVEQVVYEHPDITDFPP